MSIFIIVKDADGNVVEKGAYFGDDAASQKIIDGLKAANPDKTYAPSASEAEYDATPMTQAVDVVSATPAELKEAPGITTDQRLDSLISLLQSKGLI